LTGHLSSLDLGVGSLPVTEATHVKLEWQGNQKRSACHQALTLPGRKTYIARAEFPKA
jgi:hypothetical protein